MLVYNVRLLGDSMQGEWREFAHLETKLLLVAMAITGLGRNHAAEAIRDLLRSHPEVNAKIVNCKFP